MCMFLWCAISFHASNRIHTYHHVHRILYTILLLFSLQIVIHMCSYTLTIVCMFSVHTCACINLMFLGRVICFHASNLVHTYHHVHRILNTILLLFLLQIVVLMCSYTLTIVCMFSVHACACINSMFLGRAICLHASNLVHTYHHLHRIMYTILLLFSLQIVVHMCSYTLTIVCMFSVHACACINSMFLGCAICFHTSNRIHIHHHVHRILYTILLFSLQIVVHMCSYI